MDVCRLVEPGRNPHAVHSSRLPGPTAYEPLSHGAQAPSTTPPSATELFDALRSLVILKYRPAGHDLTSLSKSRHQKLPERVVTFWCGGLQTLHESRTKMLSTCFTTPPSYPARQPLQKNAWDDDEGVDADDGTAGPRIPWSSHSVVLVYWQNCPATLSSQMHLEESDGSGRPLPEQMIGVVVVVSVVVVSVVVVSVVDVVKVHLPFIWY